MLVGTCFPKGHEGGTVRPYLPTWRESLRTLGLKGRMKEKKETMAWDLEYIIRCFLPYSSHSHSFHCGSEVVYVLTSNSVCSLPKQEQVLLKSFFVSSFLLFFHFLNSLNPQGLNLSKFGVPRKFGALWVGKTYSFLWIGVGNREGQKTWLLGYLR